MRTPRDITREKEKEKKNRKRERKKEIERKDNWEKKKTTTTVPKERKIMKKMLGKFEDKLEFVLVKPFSVSTANYFYIQCNDFKA